MRRYGLLLAGLLFYAAPIGAGATGASYLTAIAFAPVFYFWLLLMREDGGGTAPAQIVGSILTHLLLAALCLGLGRLLGNLAGVTAEVPLMAWLALALFALLMARLVWPPSHSREIEKFADEALAKLDDMTRESDVAEDVDEPEPDPISSDDAVLRILGQLDALPANGASGSDLAGIVLATAEPSHLMDALLMRAARTQARRDRHAALLLAMEGGSDRISDVFDLIVDAADIPTLALFLDQAFQRVSQNPASAGDMPAISRLLDISGQLPEHQEELADGLVRLAQMMEDIERGEDD